MHRHADAGKRYSFGCRYSPGNSVSAADNDSLGVTSARPRKASGARRAWTSRCRRTESRSCTSEPSAGPFSGLVQQSAGTLDLYSMQSQRLQGSFAATGALAGATTITGAASVGPLDCKSLGCIFTAERSPTSRTISFLRRASCRFQQQRGPQQRPEAGCWTTSARVFPKRGGAHQCELIMINGCRRRACP